MAVDEELTQRIRERLEGLEGLSEKKMFGGICFMVNGHMVGAASRTKTGIRHYLFRVGKGREEAVARLGNMQPMEQGGRKMTGFYHVDADDCTDEQLSSWLSLALDNAFSLPPRV